MLYWLEEYSRTFGTDHGLCNTLIGAPNQLLLVLQVKQHASDFLYRSPLLMHDLLVSHALSCLCLPTRRTIFGLECVFLHRSVTMIFGVDFTLPRSLQRIIDPGVDDVHLPAHDLALRL